MTLLSTEKQRQLAHLAKEAGGAVGAAAELGVYRGGSARLIALALPHKPLFLFDTFAGLPDDIGPEDAPGQSRPGQWAASVQEVAATLRGAEPFALHYRAGLFPETAKGLEPIRFCFVHVDVDLRSSVHAACEWFAPRMSEGGIMVFDDYGSANWRGVKPCVDAFFGQRARRTAPGCNQAEVRF